MGFEKGKVNTMTIANFLQKATHVLVPMRKATIDALLLGTLIFIGLLVFTDILFTYTWLIVPIYALAYLLTVALRLRQAAHETTAAANHEQPLEGAYQELSSTKTLNEIGLHWGNHGR